MYYFIMDREVAMTPAVQRDIEIGSKKRDAKVYIQLGQAIKGSYDFREVFNAQLRLLGLQAFARYTIVTSGFENAAFFLLKYSDSIFYWVKADTPDFLNDHEAALIYKITKSCSCEPQRKRHPMEPLVAELSASLERLRQH
jgi:hypothetical protein